MTTKTCNQCNEMKPLSEFHRNHRMSDGHVNQCKVCRRPQSAQWNRDNPDRMKEARERWNAKNPKRRRQQQVLWREQNREKDNAVKTTWKTNNPEARLAHKRIHNATKSGRMVRPPKCSACDKSAKIEAHHSDYARPYDVVWLCPPCHNSKHRRAVDGDEK